MFKHALIAASIAAILSGCGADDRAYDTYEKPSQEISVRSLDTESLWMYMPSTGEAPRYALTQRGFFQGDPKLVTLRFDEFNGIYVEEVDRDKVNVDDPSRWDSEINRAPVLKIPGEFRQYRCAENSYGECTNKEEINQDESLSWKEATHFVPQYEAIKTLSQDSLSAWYTASNVSESAEPRLISYEYNAEEGVINVEVERTFTAAAEDQYQFGGDFRNLSFKTRFFYSLVKLDKLASDDYEPVLYQGQDSAYFGFFNDSKEVKTHTGESNVQGSRFSYINRFNPNNDTIDYYLSDSYFDEGNEEFLDLTIDTIREVNQTLEGTGVPTIKIVNPSSKAGVKTGDLRYNVFNLIADPVDNGLLGYGPSATNPLTGEIIHAHVNQYLGVIRSASRYTWNDLAMRYNRQEIEKLEPTATNTVDTGSDDTDAPVERTEVDDFSDMIADDRGPAFDVPTMSDDEISFITAGKLGDGLPKADMDFRFDTTNSDLAVQSFYKRQDMLKRFSEQNVYSLDFMWLSTQSKGLVKGIDYEEGDFFVDDAQTTMKTWDELNLDQQKMASLAISKHMFKSTLIHELGHNLGLRHNFMGSTDKNHFYTVDELNARGSDDKPAAYSSIMDYGASIFDELLTFGKYDKAALRFAYGRELELQEPDFLYDADNKPLPNLDSTGVQKRKVISLDKYDKAMTEDYRAYPTGIVTHIRQNADKEGLTSPLVDYRYCTDEHTTTNLMCDRFDEGTSLEEVTQFRIQRYHDSYETMNRRNGREWFSQYHQYTYFLTRLDQFQKIRDIVENVGEIDHMFARYLGADTTNNNGLVFEEIAGNNCVDWRGNPVDLDTLSPAVRPICDTYHAANLAADFFIEVLTAPDKVCELVELSGVEGVPNRYRFAPLSELWQIYQGAMSPDRDVPSTCYDEELVEVLEGQRNKVVVRSETRDGKIWSSLKANNPYQTSSSSVDLLGVWPDKLLAAQMLVRRDSPFVSTENSSLALIDMSDKVTHLYTYLSDLAGRPEARQAIFVDKNGDYVETVKRYTPPMTKTIEATPSYLWPMKRYFGLGGDEAFVYWTEGEYQDTRVPYFSALLENLNKFSRAREYGLSDSSKGLRDAIHVNYANSSYSDEDGINFTWKGTRYSISSRNTLARAMASRALYLEEQKPQLEQLNNLPYPVRNALSVFRETRDRNEARIIAIGDKDALVALRDTTGFARWTMYDKQFVKYEENGTECLRFKVDGETEEQRLQRKCNLQSRLETVQNSAIGKFEEEDHERIFNIAQVFGNQVVENNLVPRFAEKKDVYDYDPELLRLWSTNEYAMYRRAFEQFPIYDD
ncbi:zinc-dependent metalloprotease [Vibrio sinaloensis]|uniref:zinc-dependent metalloprotease n=1 Tax=Photobacterium sp. (strain ATCC 43367) TaxID=379097 RepID=UPI002F3F5A18